MLSLFKSTIILITFYNREWKSAIFLLIDIQYIFMTVKWYSQNGDNCVMSRTYSFGRYFLLKTVSPGPSAFLASGNVEVISTAAVSAAAHGGLAPDATDKLT